jgi:hypothetical protein
MNASNIFNLSASISAILYNANFTNVAPYSNNSVDALVELKTIYSQRGAVCTNDGGTNYAEMSSSGRTTYPLCDKLKDYINENYLLNHPDLSLTIAFGGTEPFGRLSPIGTCEQNYRCEIERVYGNNDACMSYASSRQRRYLWSYEITNDPTLIVGTYCAVCVANSAPMQLNNNLWQMCTPPGVGSSSPPSPAPSSETNPSGSNQPDRNLVVIIVGISIAALVLFAFIVYATICKRSYSNSPATYARRFPQEYA